MTKTRTKWHVTLAPGESRETRNHTVITNLGRSAIKLAVECPTSPASEGANPSVPESDH
jgi:hypothetical protein